MNNASFASGDELERVNTERAFVPIEEMISGSEVFYIQLLKELRDIDAELDRRSDVASVLATLAIEHAQSILLLIRRGKPSSGMALVRVQFEVLCRSFWFYFLAKEAVVERSVSPF